MPDLSYVLYDTAPFAAAANVEFLLFKVAFGGDATHIESFTNMRGAGSLPVGEKFTIKKISVVLDSFSTVIDDVLKATVSSFFDIRVNDQSLFKAPSSLLIDASAYGGSYQLAAAAAHNGLGLLGNGYELENPIMVPGGTAFYCRLFQTVALSTTYNIKVCLQGIYTLP